MGFGGMMRIPVNSTTCSGASRPSVPIEPDQSVRLKSTRSERSDAGHRSGIRFQFNRVAVLRQSGFDLSHRISFQNDFMGIMYEPVQDSIG